MFTEAVIVIFYKDTDLSFIVEAPIVVVVLADHLLFTA